MSVPDQDATWALRGEAVMCLAPRKRRLSPLPVGLQRMPGRALVMAERYDESPHGPFVTLSVGEPARLGARVGYYFGLCVVNHGEVRKLMRRHWGYPAEVGALTWSEVGNQHTVTWEERGLVLTARAGKMRWPAVTSSRSLQRRVDGPVVIPGHVRSLVRRASIGIAIPEDDPLAMLAGARRGLLLDGMVRRRHPARHPLGVFSTLRAPLRSPEPGVLGMSDRNADAAQRPPAPSSVG